jgi:hypothetical protein
MGGFRLNLFLSPDHRALNPQLEQQKFAIQKQFLLQVKLGFLMLDRHP